MPIDAKPVKSWPDSDEAFKDVVRGIRKAVEEVIVKLERAAQFQEALVSQSLDLRQKIKEQLLTEGENLCKTKRYSEALTAYEQIILFDPSDASVYLDKGRVLLYLDRYNEALVTYEQAISLDPNDEVAYIGKGLVLKGLGRLEEAKLAHDKARQLLKSYFLK